MVGLRNKILYVGTLAAGLATLIGCGGEKPESAQAFEAGKKGVQPLYELLAPDAKVAFDSAFYNRMQHGRCKCLPQEMSAVLMKAAKANGTFDDQISYHEISFIIEQELKHNDRQYAGNLFPESKE